MIGLMDESSTNFAKHFTALVKTILLPPLQGTDKNAAILANNKLIEIAAAVVSLLLMDRKTLWTPKL